MRKLLFCGTLIVAIAAAGPAAVEACGSKFLVGGKSSPRFARVLAMIQPTSILVLWHQDEDTPEEDLWNPTRTPPKRISGIPTLPSC